VVELGLAVHFERAADFMKKDAVRFDDVFIQPFVFGCHLEVYSSEWLAEIWTVDETVMNDAEFSDETQSALLLSVHLFDEFGEFRTLLKSGEELGGMHSWVDLVLLAEKSLQRRFRLAE
jgi:hypothetical protein